MLKATEALQNPDITKIIYSNDVIQAKKDTCTDDGKCSTVGIPVESMRPGAVTYAASGAKEAMD